MRHRSNRKEFVIGTIILFVFASIAPSIGGIMSDTNVKSSIEKEQVKFVSGEFIIKFREDANINILKTSNGWISTGIQSVDILNEKHEVKSIQKLFNLCEKPYLFNIYKFYIPKNSKISSIVNDYSKDPNVIYAEPNYIYKTCFIPNDPDLCLQWGLNNSGQTGGTLDADIDAIEAWDIETGNENIVVAIHDTGVDWDHPDLEENIWVNPGEDINGNGMVDPSDFNGVDDDSNGFIDDLRGWDFVNTTQPVYPGEDGTIRDNDPMDFHGHGTHCSGIAGAVTNNSMGIAGVCWNCKIMPVRVGYKSHSGGGLIDIDAAAAGLEYAAYNGANVISMSWGGNFVSELIWDAINYSYSKGALLIAAAGNSNSSHKHYPAAYDKVIAVGATDHNDSRANLGWWGSNYGSWVDVSAPGVDVYSTLFNDTYESWGGTSMATPHVAGLAALLLSKNPSFAQDELLTIIRSTTDAVNSKVHIGTGRINAYNAIQRDSTPIANLNSYLDDIIIANEIYINGTACGTNFKNYSVYYGIGIYPDEWTLIDSSTNPVTNGVLAIWDLPTPEEEVRYTILLSVYDTYNNIGLDQAVLIIDRPPESPIIDGPSSGKPGTVYKYIFNTTDPEEDDIFEYTVDWGDGYQVTISGPFASGEPVKGYHSWNKRDSYIIKAKAKDIYNAESEWGEFKVIIPKTRIIQYNELLQQLLKRFPKIFQILSYIKGL